MVGVDGVPSEASGDGTGDGGLGNEGLPELGEPGVGKDGEGGDDCEPLFGCDVGLPDGCPEEEDELGIPAEDCGDGNWISGNVDGTLAMHPLSPKKAKTRTTVLAPITNFKNRLGSEPMNLNRPNCINESFCLSMF